ncbi:MAG: tRNA pseudouridine(55) synthase TruB [Dehalococcoidia bacterium]
MGRRPRASGLDGILLVDKPSGWTSHDVVNKLRRATGQPRIGHTGTLDPAATGLLVVCLGAATRLVEYMTAHHKRYTGDIVLGATTTTDDAEGEVISSAPVPDISEAALHALEAAFSGDLQQVPPSYSAIHIDGQRAYAAARSGKVVELAPRPVRIDRLLLSQVAPDRLRLELECGPGTYVRSLARDIGAALGCGGHLASLRRTRAGRFDVEEADTLSDLIEAITLGLLERVILRFDDGILEMPAALVGAPAAAQLVMGQLPEVDIIREGAGPVRVFSSAGDFVGIAHPQGTELGACLRPAKILASRAPANEAAEARLA